MWKLIGTSGFEWQIRSVGRASTYNDNNELDVRNIKTKIPLFTLKLKPNTSAPYGVNKTFLGLDNKYYFVSLKGYRSLPTLVGQITPSGAVVDTETREVIHKVNFFPFYTEGLKKESKIPDTPPIDVAPKVIALSPKIKVSNISSIEETSWLKNLIEQIKQWIKKILTL